MANIAVAWRAGSCHPCFGQHCCSNPRFVAASWSSARPRSTRAAPLNCIWIHSFLAPCCGALLNTGFHRDATAPSLGCPAGVAWVLAPKFALVRRRCFDLHLHPQILRCGSLSILCFGGFCDHGSESCELLSAGATASAPFLMDHAKLIDSVETSVFDCDSGYLILEP